MTAKCWRKSAPLIVVLEWHGEEGVRIPVVDGDRAALEIVKATLMRGGLMPGDVIRVLKADEASQ